MGTITLTPPTADTEAVAGLIATAFSTIQTVINGNLDNANISATADLDATARVGVRKDSAGSTFERRRINFIQGSNVTLTVADDSANEEVDVTIAAAATGPTLYRKSTQKVLTSSTSATDMLNGEITIGAGVMSTDKVARVTIHGDYIHNAASDLTLKIKLGGTVVYERILITSGLGALGATRRPFKCEFSIAQHGSANANEIQGWISLLNASSTTGSHAVTFGPAANQNFVTFGNEATTIDFATSKLLEFEATYSVNSASLSLRLNHALVEVV